MANTETEDTQLSAASAVAADKSICRNCKAQLNGPYCAQCGQDSESTIKYFWLVMLHLLDDIFSFDSRASRTIWPLLTRPGFLTNEYILGRRVHYVPPLRLYLFISIIFFITLEFFAVSENGNLININNDESVLSQVTTHIGELEQQRDLLLSSEDQEQQRQSEALQLVTQQLETFHYYQTDLGEQSNKIRKAIAGELIGLEFRQIKSAKPLTESQQKQYANLTKKLAKVRNGEQVNLLTLGSSSDGTLSLPFLPAAQNAMVNDFASQLEKKASKAFQSDTGPLLEQIISKLPPLMFVLLPIFAALLKIMYLFSKRFYMEHLTVALHSHSFVFFTILLLEIIDMVQDQLITGLPWLDTSLNVVAICLLVWIPIYLFIMQKRIYQQGYIMTSVKYVVTGMAYTGLISITAMVAFIWGLTEL
ncbi:DUF3667 domain-containing protein [Thalassotalea sp. ND16A]|uniref:DUF3667 domain-containing protein n=1 Tax=Thalassotalea sp. ND16A TaxID=1535422 RepID=UPI00051A1D62|nr:DUF3667 domain-containing protein [Thalassotalea sp. ND16A]KGJ89250.1 hypothetical protein ND16A_2143 [Thalassotalea sp. ND16A]